MFIACSQPPSARTPLDYLSQIAIEHAFRDDKTAGFRLESNRLLDPRRLDALLLILGWATVHLVSIGDRVVPIERRLSRVQAGSRCLQRAVWHGGIGDHLSIDLRPDRPPRHWHDEAFLDRRLARLGLGGSATTDPGGGA